MQQWINRINNTDNLYRLTLGLLLGAVLALAGCEGGGSGHRHLGDGHDFGPNNSNLYVALGDSITYGAGLANRGDAYPVKLAGLLNKPVINDGFPGASSSEVLDVLYSILDNDLPGFVMILIGVNDLIMGYGEEVVDINIRIMVQACRDNKTIPVIATLTPVFYSYARLAGGVSRLNSRIRQIGKDLNVPVVDLNDAFNDNSAYMLSDGLHPNETGHALMAITFYDVVY